MWPDWVSNPGHLTYESGALPTALCGPAPRKEGVMDDLEMIYHINICCDALEPFCSDDSNEGSQH